jgi:hypothetical protein
MRPRFALVLGAAALGGVTAASLVSGQAGPQTAIQVISPAALLGTPTGAAAAHGLAPGWLLIPTLPDPGVATTPAQPLSPPPAVTAPAPGPAAPLPARSPLAAVLSSLPVELPAPAQLLPAVPTPPLPISLPLPLIAHPGRTGGHHHQGAGSQG